MLGKRWWPKTSRLTLFGQRQRQSAEFTELLGQLGSAQSALEDAADGLETQFLRTSSELEKLSEYGDRFVAQVGTLISQATGKSNDGAVFDEAMLLIQQTSTFLADCEQETSEMVVLLRKYNRQIDELLGVETSLNHAMLPLNIVRTLFRMESAPLGLDVQQLFGALTQEIEVLHAKMRDIFGTKFKQLEQTRQTIGLVIAKLDDQTTALRQIATTRKEHIESSLATLKREMAANVDRDLRIHLISLEMSKEVGQVVMGVQFQDIVNQKLHHVLAALPEITAKCQVFQSIRDPDAANKALQFVRQSCRLEAGQLQLAQKEMAAAEVNIQTGIQKVAGHLTQMDSQCLSLKEFTLLTTSFDGIVQVLVETIEEVRALVNTTVTNASEAFELLRPLGSLAADLTVVIRSVSQQIHLIGLNAQIKAAQVSRNCQAQGLEVLSARTSEISQETSRLSEEAATKLDAMVTGLAESVMAFEKLQTRGHEQQSQLDEQGCKYEQQLHGIRDGALSTLREIGASLEDIGRQAEIALETIQFKSFHEVTLPALRTPLLALSDAAERCLLEHDQELANDVLVDGLKRNYTMATEREVFEGITASGFEENLTPTLTATLAPESSRAVELFTEESIGLGPASPPAITADSTQPTPAATPPPPLAPPADLGANVELF